MSSIDNSAIRLICFPHAGGSSRTYIPWKQYASFLEIVTVPLPGRNFPTGSQTPTNFAELSEALMHHVRQMVNGVPYALFGHSMGALLAYEVTRLIEKAAARLPMAVFVSGCRSPQRWTQHGCRSSWTDSYILSNLVELGGTPKELVEHKEMREILLPILRYDYAMIDSYVYKHTDALRSSIGVLGGLEDADVTLEDLNGWLQLSCGRTQLKTFSGGHFFLNSEMKEVVTFVERFLDIERGV